MFYTITSKTGASIMGKRLLAPFSCLYEIMQVPTFSLTLPLKMNNYLDARAEIELYVNNKLYHGRLIKKTIDKINETIICEFTHIVGELSDKLTPINYNVKEKTLEDAMNDENLTSNDISKTYVNISDANIVDYTFSKISKLEVLDEICKLNEKLYWRVNLNSGRTIEFFEPDIIPVKMISLGKASNQNIQIITENEIVYDWNNVINMATVYGNKSDTGNSSLTLDPKAQAFIDQIDPKFPVVAINADVANNERKYTVYDSIRAGDNTNVEWAIIDLDGIDLENGIVLESNFTFNDIYPIPDVATEDEKTKEITEENIIDAQIRLYKAGVRKLIHSRRKATLRFTTTEIDARVGDCVHLLYTNQIVSIDNCGEKSIITIRFNDDMYIQSIETIIQVDGTELDEVVLTDNLYDIKEDNTDYA